MGTKGLKGIEKLLLGSVAENVLRHSKVPVMIVR
jgi:nucleotide-binding universal stress UspA family protein